MPGRILTDRNADDETQRTPVGDFNVLSWRYECLEDAGYPVDIAVLLAERSDVDLHRACELLERGCSAHKAVRILLY